MSQEITTLAAGMIVGMTGGAIIDVCVRDVEWIRNNTSASARAALIVGAATLLAIYDTNYNYNQLINFDAGIPFGVIAGVLINYLASKRNLSV